jgi:SagB-type dehydrogenase family enzyme
MKSFVVTITFLFGVWFSNNYTQDLKPIQLPQPQTEIGKPLMQVLKLRQSTRSFDSKPLPLQELSNLLWAAYGINRPESGKRTAPSAMNWQEFDIYVVLEDGVYVYYAKENVLNQIEKGDYRALCGGQDFVKSAPLNLVYVADLSRVKKMNNEDISPFVGMDSGFIAQNVYLYCASQGLGVVARAGIDGNKFAETLKLKADQKVILAQTIGYSK